MCWLCGRLTRKEPVRAWERVFHDSIQTPAHLAACMKAKRNCKARPPTDANQRSYSYALACSLRISFLSLLKPAKNHAALAVLPETPRSIPTSLEAATQHGSLYTVVCASPQGASAIDRVPLLITDVLVTKDVDIACGRIFVSSFANEAAQAHRSRLRVATLHATCLITSQTLPKPK